MDKNELEKCKDPVYFAKHYVKIQNPDGTFSHFTQAQLDIIAFIEKAKSEGKGIIKISKRGGPNG